MSAIIIQTTVPEEKEGERLAGLLLDEKLAACVWVLPAMHSFYIWKGKRECDREFLLIIKTLNWHTQSVFELIEREHSYQCPEIISFPTDHISKGYLSFMQKAVGEGVPPSTS